MFFDTYSSILIFLAVSLLIACAVVLLPFFVSRVLGNSNQYREKLSPYECGFEPFSDRPSNFNIKFFVVAMLFVVFDLEIVIMLPWAMNITKLGGVVFATMMFFIGILLLGLLYEIKKGAVDNWT